MSLARLRQKIDATTFIDTHEHLLEEKTRLRGAGFTHDIPCTDAALLFHHYTDNDLHSAGMPQSDRDRFYAPDIPAAEKWRLLEPYWQRCQHTGYAQAVRWTACDLFGEAVLDAASFARISEQMQEHARPGFYRDVLRVARVESCQVNSFEAICCQSEYPDLLRQDLSIFAMTQIRDLPHLQRETGIAITTLDDMCAVIDWYFDHHGPRAVAVKNQAAYDRRLNYDDVPAEVAAPLFARQASGEDLSPSDLKPAQDYLMHYCIRKAIAFNLPIKLHCGYYAGNDRMPLHRVRRNASDLCPLLEMYPAARFVLMHIGYPYQDEYIALAKHYANVHIDLCWAWIVNPLATVRFVREFLMAAPASKLFTFGGDYSNVEPIVGHAHVARQGLAQALSELVDGGWLSLDDALALVDPLMHGNARRVFRLPTAVPAFA